MKWPNFFIIGAPKCGTTSLAVWLSEHPNVYISPWKEPRFFDRDLKTRARIDWPAYRALFEGAGDEYVAVGEATVWYLYSKEAVPNIEREIPDSRYIVMVRNPVDMAYALHEQLSLNGAEHIRDFKKAWRLSPLRREGKAFRPWFISEPRLLDYQQVCCLGEQIERLYDLVPRERVLVIVLDDLKKDPRKEYLRVLEFLGVPDDGRTDFSPKNPAKRVRSYLFQNIIFTGMKMERSVKNLLRKPPTVSKVWQALNSWNKVARPRPPLPEDLRKEMAAYFAADVHKLEKLLERDLSHWLEVRE